MSRWRRTLARLPGRAARVGVTGIGSARSVVRAALTLVAVGSLLGALALVLVPDLLALAVPLDAVERALVGTGEGEPEGLLSMLAWLTAGYAAWVVLARRMGWRLSTADEGDADEAATYDERAAARPEDPAGGVSVLGSVTDDLLRRGADEESRYGASMRNQLRASLRGLAIDAHARSAAVDREAAASAVDDGIWTDDPLAAAFLAGEASGPSSADPPSTGVEVPLLARLRAWLVPGWEFRHRARRTAAAVERTATGAASGPERHRESAGRASAADDEDAPAHERRLDPAATPETSPGDSSDPLEPTATLTTSTTSTTRVYRFEAGILFTLVLGAVGVATGSPTALLATVVPVAYLLYGTVARPPSDPELGVERRIHPATPTPGDRVTVTLAVHNAGDRVLPDLRVVDGVPADLAVVEGSPRACLALRPGETETVEYTVLARHGDHAFDSPGIRLRSPGATWRRDCAIAVEGAETLTAATAVGDVPLGDRSLRRQGTLPTDRGGDGIEFYGVREYEPGDPLSRVDWWRLARGEDPGTVEFRDQRTSSVVVVADARPRSRSAGEEGSPSGATLSAYAAERAYAALSGAGNHVGAAVVGLDATESFPVPRGPDGLVWVPPGRDRETLSAATLAFEWVADRGGDRPDERVRPRATGADLATGLVGRLSSTVQVVLATPAVDPAVSELVRSLASAGHAVTVVSPDVTAGDDDRLGRSVVRSERALRLDDLRESGARVVDWDTETPLGPALSGALASGVTGR